MGTPRGSTQPSRAVGPPTAAEAAALLPLLAAALSAGDVEAALSLYAPGAVVVPWHLPAMGGDGLRDLLTSLAALKVPLHLASSTATGDERVAVVQGRWSMSDARGADSLRLVAEVMAIARRDRSSPEPVWHLVLERWTTPDGAPPR